MKEITLEQLSVYLPYKLQLKSISSDLINIMNGEVLDWLITRKDSTILPILRPLTDLTKEIEMDGTKLIFSNFYLSKMELQTIEKCIEMKLDLLDFISAKVYLKLLQHHFDIYNLIEQGLAIDINTLNN